MGGLGRVTAGRVSPAPISYPLNKLTAMNGVSYNRPLLAAETSRFDRTACASQRIVELRATARRVMCDGPEATRGEAMQGHIRKRGAASWEYTIDVGRAPAQRCRACRRRFWVERRPKETCPDCGGELSLGDERRRETKGGFATRREAQTAMSKVAVAVEERTHVASSRLTLREYLTKDWLPAIEHTIRPTTYRSYVAHVECHILPALGSVQLQKLSAAQINALYAKLGRSGKRNGQGLTALSVRHVHAVLHRSLKDAVRWGWAGAQPGRSRRPAASGSTRP